MSLYLIKILPPIVPPDKDIYGESPGQEFGLKDDEEAKEKARVLLDEVRKSGINSPGAKIFKLVKKI